MRRAAGDWNGAELSGGSLGHLIDKRVVTIGGGTGPFALLQRLKHYPCQITAIVTMADSGGSSRRLTDEFGQLPFGDLRQALVALSRQGALWRDIFNHRFRPRRLAAADATQVVAAGDSGVLPPLDELPPAIVPGGERQHPADTDHQLTGHAGSMGANGGVSGHSLGNLILSALQDINDDNLLWAIEDAQELLATAGQVLPVTLAHATLCAELADGTLVRGETEIDTRGERHLAAQLRPTGERAPEEAVGPVGRVGPLPALAGLPPIARIFLEPGVPACAEALRAIRRADVLILGPGDLYTSILPNLLVEGVAAAIRASEAETVYVCNLMTKHGETDGYKASDFVRTLHGYLGDRVDRVILHDGSLPEHLVGLYAAKAQQPVEADVAAVRALVPEVRVEALLAVHQETLVRHDADRLLHTIFERRAFEVDGQPEAKSSPARARANREP